jgi:hypothetical protein
MKPHRNSYCYASVRCFLAKCSGTTFASHLLSLAMLVVLTSCSRSSPEVQTQSTEIGRKETESALATPPVLLGGSTQEQIVTASTSGLSKTGFRTMQREITLNRQQPSNSFIGARLVEIASDGTTTIEILETTNRLQAGVGAFFTSEDYGRSGLQVLSASFERQEVRLVRTWCELHPR